MNERKTELLLFRKKRTLNSKKNVLKNKKSFITFFVEKKRPPHT